MHILTQFETFQVHGGYEYNIKDAILTSSAFSTLFGIAGAGVCASWFLSYHKQVALDAIVALNHGYPLLTLTIAIFAGLGAGGCLGSLVGLACYYSGLITPAE